MIRPVAGRTTYLKEYSVTSSPALQGVIVSKGRDALSRAVRQTIQALIPTLLVIAGGTTYGINLKAVGILAGLTALVSLLKSLVDFRVDPLAPAWAHIAERAATAAAGTALGLVTVDGVVPAAMIDWRVTLTASVGSAVLAVAMFYTNPPVAAVSDDVSGYRP